MQDKIKIKGAKEHNLKDIDLEIPRNKMVVFTGVSGSGKSSLAFDTIFAEGQRRYMESLSSYARQFLDKMEKPDVDEIQGLSPSISIKQKNTSSNPRSTVGTSTEIYDFLRVLFARAGKPFCPLCGEEIQELSLDDITDKVVNFIQEKKKETEQKSVAILSPVVRGRKGEHYQLLYDLLGEGFTKARIDGNYRSLRERTILDKHKKHTIEIVTDRIPLNKDLSKKNNRLRISEAIEEALRLSENLVTISFKNIDKHFSSKFACPNDGFSFPEIEPRFFSFNSPYGACAACHGLGTKEYKSEETCEKCKGERLREEALNVFIKEKNISEITAMSIKKAREFFQEITEDIKNKVTKAPLREINNRLKFLEDVGLDYLTLDRKAGTLSNGEAQRIRLASQIGSKLTGTLYVLDEPTIGLHQKDNTRLINTLKDLKDLGNTILVIEHDEQTIRASDYLVDIGPGPGEQGGEIVTTGEIPDIIENDKKQSLTLDYLRKDKQIKIPKRRRVNFPHDSLKVKGAKEHNLKDIDVKIPLRRLSVLTGVSGSGKSSLMTEVIYKNLKNKLHRGKTNPGEVDEIKGTEYLKKVINIDQSPIGKTPRSNPATYSGIWGYIRKLFASTEEARVRGYEKGRFSFNTQGGRCENCKGHGKISVEMHFLPTVYITCETCQGKRYNRETLEVEYKGKNIYEILQMTVDEAYDFFSDIPWLENKLSILKEVGLGYLRLGQPSPTLSGGEAQRVKLAKELGKPQRKKTLYLLDEPTTGLHFHDIKKLIKVLQKLIDKNNTVMIIEHNLEVIKSADWIIDLGPGGGKKGGEIVAVGSPEEIIKEEKSYTGQYLKKVL